MRWFRIGIVFLSRRSGAGAKKSFTGFLESLFRTLCQDDPYAILSYRENHKGMTGAP